MTDQPAGSSSGGSNQGPWIIAGSIVLATLLVIIAIVVLTRDDTPTPLPSPSVSASPSEEPSPSPSRTKSPRPSPSPAPSPSPSPSPVVDNAALVREASEQYAEADRPGEVKHVGNVAFFKDTACATRKGASTSVRYDTGIKQGTFFLCLNTKGRWKVTQGPLYGE